MNKSTSTWNKIRKEICNLTNENIKYAKLDNEVIAEAFAHPRIQKHLQHYISSRGLDWAFENFSNFYGSTINEFVESGIIPADLI